MRRASRLLTVVLLWAALPQLAAAQGQETLQRHTAALDNLVASVNQLGTDNTASLDALESAASTMRLLERDTESSTLVAAMEQVFENARLAIRNQSRADLSVQTAVLRGGFQRGLMESSLATGSVAAAQPGFNQLASELNLDGEALDGIAAASNLEQLLASYRAGLARNMASRLEVMDSQFQTDQAAAYVTLAGAYGTSLSIQDAPQTPADLNRDFSELISAVVAGDQEVVLALSADLQEVLNGLGAAGPTETAPEPAPAQGAPEPAPVEDSPEPAPAEQPAAPAAVETVTEEAPAEQPEVAEAPAQETTVEPTEAGPEAPAEQALPTLATLADLRDEVQSELEQQQFDTLVNDLGRRGLRGQAGENLASQLQARGYGSVAQVIGDTLELAARAADAAQRGEQAASQQYLGQLETTYRSNLAPLASRADPTLDRSITSLLGQLTASPAVRSVELHSLTGLLAAVGSTGGSTTLDTLQSGSAGWSSGWPRMALLIITALLAILPLVFLRLAFGGGNRNWSLIGTGLFLLLLPVILGGIGALLELIGHFAGIGMLHEISAWFTLDGALQQLLLIVLELVATILLATGLYGICKQFGLFGGEGGGRRLFGRARSEGKSETRTLVDWDEEF